MGVKGWQTPMRNERKRGIIRKVLHPQDMILQEKGLSGSIHVVTRKMVSYYLMG